MKRLIDEQQTVVDNLQKKSNATEDAAYDVPRKSPRSQRGGEAKKIEGEA